ncbi:MAG TPA: heat-inducible transcriptional repressor HrcA [Lactobacillaceae bacterium]|jgi:heat-inducible transcriptional repressor
MTLTQRQKLILAAIITEYTQTGLPVGSKTLEEQLAIKVSSATIRNEMVVLEEAGLLTKAHTSSGRVPSARGYRYYIDYLLPNIDLAHVDLAPIREQLAGTFHEVGDVLDKAVHALAAITNYTAIVLKPAPDAVKVSGFRLVELAPQHLIAVLVTSDGNLTSQTFTLPHDVPIESLDDMVTYINEQLVGRQVSDVLSLMQTDLPAQFIRTVRNPGSFLQLFGDVLSRSIGDDVQLGGRLNVLDFSEITHSSDVRHLLELLDNAPAMRRLVASLPQQINTQIGPEIDETLLHNISVVNATFTLPDLSRATLALIGPMHMPYARMLPLVAAFGSVLDEQMLNYR